MIREMTRRLRVLERNRTSALISAAVPLIPLEDGEWLLSLPMKTAGTGWDLCRLTREQTTRAEAILSDAIAAARQQGLAA